jgi:hypothetical protein
MRLQDLSGLQHQRSISPVPKGKQQEREQEHHDPKMYDDCAHDVLSSIVKASSLTSSKDKQHTAALEKCGSLVQQDGFSSKRHWMSMLRKNVSTTSGPTKNNHDNVQLEGQEVNNSNKDDQRRQNEDLMAPPRPPQYPLLLADTSICDSPTFVDGHSPALPTDPNKGTTTSLIRRKAATPTQLLKWAFDASMSLYDHLGDDDDDDDDNFDGDQDYYYPDLGDSDESLETLWNKHACFGQHDSICHYNNHDNEDKRTVENDIMHDATRGGFANDVSSTPPSS